MIGNWTTWKQFPSAERGEHIEAPIGPGVYEVRDMATGDLMAFDAAANVAHALSALRKPPRPCLGQAVRRRPPRVSHP